MEAIIPSPENAVTSLPSLNASSFTTLTEEQGDKEVFLSVDGVAVPFLDGDELVVARSDKTLLMARVKDRSFFDIVFEKLVDK